MEKNLSLLNETIREAAVSKGLCQKWQARWQIDWSLEKMAIKFYEGIDFYFSTRFITPDFIEKNFPKDFLRKQGLVINDKYSLLNPKYAAILGDSISTIRINGNHPCTIYVADNSNTVIKATQNAFVIIHILDKAQVKAEAYDNAHVKLINHSIKTNIEADANISVCQEFNWPDNL